jgi:hypothetical protein
LSLRKIYGTIKEKERWKIRKMKEIKGLSTGKDVAEVTVSLQIRCYVHIKRMQSQRMPKQTASATREGTKKNGRPQKRWRDGVEEDLI